ncbi:MAG: acyl-ACP--UDP-N-acetylglucosamine O-acyltransferase [Chlamydiota bacterium]|nr:acyl-ACP--UDP-N-acetylglucosamine O-acyltransferase [Chlamydiota bacterium]
MNIDQRAIIHPSAKIGENVSIGPFSIIGANVELGHDCIVDAHVIIGQDTSVGPGCHIHSWAAVGTDSQDRKYHGEKAYARVGANTVIREFVTINRGTGEETETRIGDNCLLLAYAHVAHNCELGNGVILANAGTLAGHVIVQDCAIIGGLVAIHQFCRVGQHAIIGGCSKVVQDVLPYSMADGHPAILRGLNTVGLKRRGFAPEVQSALKTAFRILIRSGLSIKHAVEKIQQEYSNVTQIQDLIQFIQTSQRGICINRHVQTTDVE